MAVQSLSAKRITNMNLDHAGPWARLGMSLEQEVRTFLNNDEEKSESAQKSEPGMFFGSVRVVNRLTAADVQALQLTSTGI